jgi:2,4-dienoyl-CoA reductase-like NADH-dependent reductase (Old Yellow Enzyme family)
MNKLFEPLKINKLEMKNRFIRSATVDNQGQNGRVTEIQEKRYAELARGEVGLICSSGLFPSQDGWSAPGQPGIHRDEMIPSLAKLVKAVHENGGKIAAQLMHAGWYGNPEVSGLQVVGPSAMVNPASGREVRELSSDEIWEHVDDYIQAGRRAVEAGFDAVQLHGAHGWLISAFLSPATNRRQDQWGGSAEKRAAFALRISEGLRRMAGPDYPLLIKLGFKDYHPQGKSLQEGIETAIRLEKAGMDAIEVSEGIEEQPFHHIRQDATSPYYLEECREARLFLKAPLILVGGMRKLREMEQALEGNAADAVSMCRPFIMDPYLVKKLREGAAEGSACTSCNACVKEMQAGRIRCVLKE